MDLSRRITPPWKSLTLVVMATLIGCVPPRDPSARGARTLTETAWMLSEIAGQAAIAQPDGRRPQLRFDAEDARVAGFTGCNNFGGAYALDGDRLTFPKPLATTRMACLDPAVSRQEQSFLDALQRTGRFALSGEVLTFYDGEEAVARFTADDGP